MATRSSPRTLEEIILDLQNRIHALETSARIGSASIQDGGQLVVLDATGTPVLRIGTLSVGGYGIERYDSGTSTWVAVT